MAGSFGYASKLGLGAANPVTEAYEFVSESLALTRQVLDTSGLRGTRSHPAERLREGTRSVGGTIVFQPTPVELANLLPRILGAAASGNTFALAETLPSFFASVDRVAKVFTYSGCKVNRARFRGSAGGPLVVELDIVGQDEAVANAGTFPALTLDETTSPFVFTDLVLVVGGQTYQLPDFELVVDNAIDTGRYLNSLTLTEVTATDRAVSVSTRLPYGDATAAYGLAVPGVAVTATFTNGGTSLLFTLPAVTFQKQSPVVGGRQEVFLPLAGRAYKSGATAELVVTLDSTP